MLVLTERVVFNEYKIESTDEIRVVYGSGGEAYEVCIVKDDITSTHITIFIDSLDRCREVKKMIIDALDNGEDEISIPVINEMCEAGMI